MNSATFAHMLASSHWTAIFWYQVSQNFGFSLTNGGFEYLSSNIHTHTSANSINEVLYPVTEAAICNGEKLHKRSLI